MVIDSICWPHIFWINAVFFPSENYNGLWSYISNIKNIYLHYTLNAYFVSNISNILLWKIMFFFKNTLFQLKWKQFQHFYVYHAQYVFFMSQEMHSSDNVIRSFLPIFWQRPYLRGDVVYFKSLICLLHFCIPLSLSQLSLILLSFT